MEFKASAVLFFLSSILFFSSGLADPDPLQDFCVADPNATAITVNGFPCKPAAVVTSDDFFFDGLTVAGDTNNTLGSSVASANVLSFPALNTLGVSMNRVDIAPGGVNPPHSHPRSSELVFLVSGRLLVGFVSSDNRFYSKVLERPGETFVIPRGLIHFQFNVGEEKALAITTFNSQLPGVVLAPLSLFGATPEIPDEVLEKALQVDKEVVALARARFLCWVGFLAPGPIE